MQEGDAHVVRAAALAIRKIGSETPRAAPDRDTKPSSEAPAAKKRKPELTRKEITGGVPIQRGRIDDYTERIRQEDLAQSIENLGLHEFLVQRSSLDAWVAVSWPHPIRYYGYYSNKSGGMRKKAAAEQAEKAGKPSGGDDPSGATRTGCSSWAMLIKRVYEVDPLSCPRCASEMKVVAFIDPPQGEVIDKILRHCGLWRHSAPRPPPDLAGVVHGLDGCFSDSPTGSCDQACELTWLGNQISYPLGYCLRTTSFAVLGTPRSKILCGPSRG